jgi:hypothetical protein
MSPHPLDESGTVSERFEYFMIRVTRSDKDPERVSGLLERLGSGEKRSFETGNQLLQMVGGWFAFDLNLQPLTEPRNPTDNESTDPPLAGGV